jgi:DNA-binding Lrp family transcriptional regulator
MDEKDRLLLICLQNGLPLTPRPFDFWSAKIGADSAELLVRIQRLKKRGIFGEIKAILDPRAFYYQSAWVAMRLGQEGEELASRAEVLWQHPGVIYGCEREHEFNVWFFIAAPSNHDLELHVRCLEKLAGAHRTLFLPVRKVFKGTDFLSSLDAQTFQAMSERFEKRQKVGLPDLTSEEIEMVRQLQEPFPLTDEPYQEIALRAGITEAQVLEWMRSLVGKGCLKKIGSFLKPAVVPLETRTLAVWQVPEEKLERIGPGIAEFREVLYADRRPAYPEFPYSLYTMIRAGTAAELEVVMRRIEERIGKWPQAVLVTTREFKKERMKYFPKGLDGWWRKSRHVVETAFIMSQRPETREQGQETKKSCGDF